MFIVFIQCFVSSPYSKSHLHDLSCRPETRKPDCLMLGGGDVLQVWLQADRRLMWSHLRGSSLSLMSPSWPRSLSNLPHELAILLEHPPPPCPIALPEIAEGQSGQAELQKNQTKFKLTNGFSVNDEENNSETVKREVYKPIFINILLLVYTVSVNGLEPCFYCIWITYSLWASKSPQVLGCRTVESA